MLPTDPRAIWLGIAVILAIVIVAVVVTAVRRRHSRDFEVRPLPADRVESFTTRLDELESQFVTRPRESVAEARQVVDEMLALKGYPARLGPDGRARDLAYANREHAKRYRTAVVVGDRSTTEEMRQAMEHLLTIGREMLSEAGPVATTAPATTATPPAPVTPADETPVPAAEPLPPEGTDPQTRPVFGRGREDAEPERERATERGERRLAG